MKWLMEPEQQAERFSGSGYLPAVSSASELSAAQDILERYPVFRIPPEVYPETPPTPNSVEQMLLACGESRDREKAPGLLGEALGAAQQMGMVKVASDCEALLAGAQGVIPSD